MKNNFFTSVTASIVICFGTNAQNFEWAQRMGGTGGDASNSIVVDAIGNVYTTGHFNGTVDFDPKSGIFELTAVGSQDIFISKLDSNGDFVWAKRMGGTGFDRGNSIAVDVTGNVYTIGYFESTADFDPENGVFELTSAGGDMFISKLDSNGDFVWAKQMEGTTSTSNSYGNSIAIDALGNIYTTGQFSETVDFDPEIGVFELTPLGNFDIFISKLNTDGNFVWAKRMGGANNDAGVSITFDAAGNVYTTGFFTETVDFNPGVGIHNLISGGSPRVFISKLDTNGDFVWAKQMGALNSGQNQGFSINVDAAGYIYTTGYFTGTVDFDPGVGVHELTSAGHFDVFISKLKNNGDFVWAKSMGGPGTDVGYSIAVDASGNIYTTGYFPETADFDPGVGIHNLTSANNVEIFISKLNTEGNFVWAAQINGPDWDVSTSIALDATGNVYTTGSFKSTIDFDPGSGVHNLTSAGTSDIFVHKISQGAIASISETDFANSILVYPNPANESVTITNIPSGSTVSVRDVTGKIIYNSEVEQSTTIINTENFVNGVYFVTIENNGNTTNVKLVVNK